MYTLQIRTSWGEIDACIFLTALNTCTSAHTSSTGGHHSWQHLLLSTRASYAEGDCVLNKRRTVRQNNEQLWNHHLRHLSHSASFFALWPMILTVNGDRRSCIFWVYSPGTHTEAAPLTGTTSVTTKWRPLLLRTSSNGSSPKAPSDFHVRTPLPSHLYLKLDPARCNIKIPWQVIIQ